jgi:hypothetical protein
MRKSGKMGSGVTYDQLHCHDGEDEPGNRAYWGRRQQSERQHDYVEGMPVRVDVSQPTLKYSAGA